MNVTEPRFVALSRLTDALLYHQVLFDEVDTALLLRVVHTHMLKDLVVYLGCTFIGELCRYPSGFLQFECNVVSATRVEHNVLYWCIRSALYVIPSVQLTRFTTLSLSFVLGFLVDTTLFRVLHSWVFTQRFTSAGVQE
ncbi:hypothetical protein KPN3_21 [Klebsiella phage KPN3]|uniref:Uncharacterized protein n=1 Tax=Klebsiella phage KPN3 TaxID=2601621 RepID=A0A5B9NFI2_9CAUD|nr:hypothetical protein KPN3_21 [Klebsiella phage KPN3]